MGSSKIKLLFFNYYLSSTSKLSKYKNINQNKMFLVNWTKNTISSALEKVGLKRKQSKTILVMGLDNSGKSTLLVRLKHHNLPTVCPTLYTYPEEFVLPNATYKIWDLGGYHFNSKAWRDYLTYADALIFMVDASDLGRLRQSRDQFLKLMEQPLLSDVPIAILGNKIDKANCLSEEELRERFFLVWHDNGVKKWDERIENRQIKFYMCSVVRKVGYTEALDWINTLIK